MNIDHDIKAAGSAGMGDGAAAGAAVDISSAAGVGLGIALSPINAPSVVSSLMNYVHIYIYFSVLRRDLLVCYYLMQP